MNKCEKREKRKPKYMDNETGVIVRVITDQSEAA